MRIRVLTPEFSGIRVRVAGTVLYTRLTPIPEIFRVSMYDVVLTVRFDYIIVFRHAYEGSIRSRNVTLIKQ